MSVDGEELMPADREPLIQRVLVLEKRIRELSNDIDSLAPFMIQVSQELGLDFKRP